MDLQNKIMTRAKMIMTIGLQMTTMLHAADFIPTPAHPMYSNNVQVQAQYRPSNKVAIAANITQSNTAAQLVSSDRALIREIERHDQEDRKAYYLAEMARQAAQQEASMSRDRDRWAREEAERNARNLSFQNQQLRKALDERNRSSQGSPIPFHNGYQHNYYGTQHGVPTVNNYYSSHPVSSQRTEMHRVGSDATGKPTFWFKPFPTYPVTFVAEGISPRPLDEFGNRLRTQVFRDARGVIYEWTESTAVVGY
jgi:hypothetical protein